MNFNLLNVLTLSGQSNKENRLFRGIILCSIIIFMVSTLILPITATSISPDSNATIPDAIQSAIPEQIATEDTISVEISDREQKILNNYLIIDDRKITKVQPSQFTVHDRNISIVSMSDNLVINSVTELPEGGFIEFGADGKTRYFSSDGIEQSASNDIEAEKIRTGTGALIPVSHSIEVPSGSTIHRKGKFLHVSDHGKILLTIVDNSQQDKSGILEATQSRMLVQDSGVNPQSQWGFWAAYVKYHHAANIPYRDYNIKSFNADWRLPDNLARTNQNAEPRYPSNVIFNGIQYTDPLSEAVILQPVTAFNRYYENAWEGRAHIQSDHWSITSQSPIQMNKDDFVNGRIGYLASSDRWYVYLEDTTTSQYSQVFLDDDSLRNYGSDDCKKNPTNCKMTDMKNFDLYLAYEAHHCYPNDYGHPELDWTCPVVDSNQAKTTDIEFSAVHAYVDNSQSYVEIENTPWTTGVFPDSKTHPNLTGLHVEAYPHSASIYTNSNSFTIIPIAGIDGSISPSTSQTVGKGGSQIFHIIPENNGHVIDKIVIDNDWDNAINFSDNYQTYDYIFSNVRNDRSIIATFKTIAVPSYTITPTIVGTGGSINPSTEVNVSAGASKAFIVNANTNYVIDTIVVNSIPQTITNKSSMTVTLSNVQSNSQITATFKTAPPLANFTASPRSGPAPLTVRFTDTSTGLPNTWTWNFGDGNTTNATARNPVHTYYTNGSFNVSLTATNAGGSDITTKTRFVNLGLRDQAGVFRNGVFYLRKSPTVTTPVSYGLATDTPLVGDWTGTGTDTVGVWRTGVFYLRESPTVTTTISYGLTTDTPLVGDWTGTGTDTVGVWRGLGIGAGVFYLRNSPMVTTTIYYGLANDTPLIWNDNGISKVGVYHDLGNGAGVFYLRKNETFTTTIPYGLATDTPLAGDWTGTGADTVGVWRNGAFYLRESPTVTTTIPYGLSTDTPFVGTWG